MSAENGGTKKESVPETPKWSWDNGRMTIAFIPEGNGKYSVKELSDPVNPHTKLPIASLAKSMSAIIVLDAIKKGDLKPNQLIQIYPESRSLPDSKFAVNGLPKQWGHIPIHSALTQLLQISSNTMAMNLAIATAGSSEQFVMRMNEKAKAWGMMNTHFVNEHGLPVGDRKSEHTTAKDMIIMAERMIPFLEDLKKYTNAPLTYWQPPPEQKRSSKISPDHDKLALISEGAILKTATINGCQSLLTIVPTNNVIVADVQLCAPKNSRFKSAITSLKAAFSKLTNEFIPVANSTPQSSPPAPPSIE